MCTRLNWYISIDSFHVEHIHVRYIDASGSIGEQRKRTRSRQMGKNVGSWLKRSYSQERDALLSIILALFITSKSYEMKPIDISNARKYFEYYFVRKL